jgi:hypothetical protein
MWPKLQFADDRMFVIKEKMPTIDLALCACAGPPRRDDPMTFGGGDVIPPHVMTSPPRRPGCARVADDRGVLAGHAARNRAPRRIRRVPWALMDLSCLIIYSTLSFKLSRSSPPFPKLMRTGTRGLDGRAVPAGPSRSCHDQRRPDAMLRTGNNHDNAQQGAPSDALGPKTPARAKNVDPLQRRRPSAGQYSKSYLARAVRPCRLSCSNVSTPVPSGSS